MVLLIFFNLEILSRKINKCVFLKLCKSQAKCKGISFPLAFSAPDLKLDDLCKVDMARNNCLCMGVSITKVPIAKFMQSLRE